MYYKDLKKINTTEDILNFRIQKPNCLYCEFLEDDFFFFRCLEKDKRFFGNVKWRAKRCSKYSPRTTDLQLALETCQRMQEEYDIIF